MLIRIQLQTLDWQQLVGESRLPRIIPVDVVVVVVENNWTPQLGIIVVVEELGTFEQKERKKTRLFDVRPR